MPKRRRPKKSVPKPRVHNLIPCKVNGFCSLKASDTLASKPLLFEAARVAISDFRLVIPAEVRISERKEVQDRGRGNVAVAN
jgi:hypothetical protein